MTKHYSGFLLSRIIQGIGAGSCMALSRSILRDCFEGNEYVRSVSYLSSGFAIGLGLTPVVGGYLIAYFPWQSEFIFLLLCSITLFFCFLFLLPETHAATRPKVTTSVFTLHIISLFFQTLKNKNFIGYLLGGIMAYSVLVVYNTMAPFLFQQTFGHSGMVYGWLTFSLSAAYYLGTAANRRWVLQCGIHFMMKSGLALIILAGVFMLVYHLISGQLNLYCIMLPLWVATFGQSLIWSNCIAAALEDLSAVSGTASAFFSSLQMLVSAFISAIIALLPGRNPLSLSLVIVVLGLISGGNLHCCF